jgi:hypothetical protein
MSKTQMILMLLGVFAAGVSSGCVAAAIGAGAGTVAYIRGDLEAEEAKGIDAVYKATLKAMDELELAVNQKSKDEMTATVATRDAEDKKITVKLKATATNSTKISIRIGIFGDETKSRLIYEKIKENL